MPSPMDYGYRLQQYLNSGPQQSGPGAPLVPMSAGGMPMGGAQPFTGGGPSPMPQQAQGLDSIIPAAMQKNLPDMNTLMNLINMLRGQGPEAEVNKNMQRTHQIVPPGNPGPNRGGPRPLPPSLMGVTRG